MESNRKTDEQKHKEALKYMSMLFGFAAAIGAMAPDGGYTGQIMEDFEDDELADIV